MTQTSDLSKDDLDRFLAWLSPDREAAGVEFLKIRAGLARFFTTRGASDAEYLTDETVNRVARRLREVTPHTDRPISYVFGFAKNVFFEYLRDLKTMPVQFEGEFVARDETSRTDDEDEARFDCLDDCLANLKAEEADVLLKYFGAERGRRIEVRRKIADGLSITSGNLHIRVYRLKAALRSCINSCLDKKVL